MRRARAPLRSSGRVRRVGLAAVGILLVVSGPVSGAAAARSTGPSTGVVPAGAHPVVTQSFPGTLNAQLMGSTGARSLSVIERSNGTYELLLFDAASNTSSVLVASSPAATIVPAWLTAAGGAFFLSIWNTTALRDLIVQVNTSGSYGTVTFPLWATGGAWLFPYGNSSALFGSIPGELVELNPIARTMVRNFSASLPSDLEVESLLPSGHFLYLAGTLTNVTGATSVYFGRLNVSNGHLAQLSTTHFLPLPYSAEFLSLGARGVNIWVGGGVAENFVSPASGTPVQVTNYGLLYVYNTSTRSFNNRTSLLAFAPTAVPFAIVPWRSTLMLSIERYDYTATSSSTYGWLFTLDTPSKHLVNQTALQPAGFTTDYVDVTSVSGGYLFLSGISGAKTAQVVAITV